MTRCLDIFEVKQRRIFGVIQIKEILDFLKSFEEILDTVQSELETQIENVKNPVWSVYFFRLCRPPLTASVLVIPIMNRVHIQRHSFQRENLEHVLLTLTENRTKIGR